MRSLSPFMNGSRNPTYKNPTMASNQVFYGKQPSQRGSQYKNNIPLKGESRQFKQVKRTSQINDDARSVHTDRHYTKSRSRRSNKQSVRSNNQSVRSNISNRSKRSRTSQRKSKREQNSVRSGKNSQTVASKKLMSQKSNRSKQEKLSRRSDRLYRSFHSSKCPTEYVLVSGSNISNPDNLICDNCVNNDMTRNKLNDLRDQKE